MYSAVTNGSENIAVSRVGRDLKSNAYGPLNTHHNKIYISLASIKSHYGAAARTGTQRICQDPSSFLHTRPFLQFAATTPVLLTSPSIRCSNLTSLSVRFISCKSCRRNTRAVSLQILSITNLRPNRGAEKTEDHTDRNTTPNQPNRTILV